MTRAIAALALLAGACAPEITAGAYYCGPEEACPDDLFCDGPTATCVYASQVQPFFCEPDLDDVPADARDVGVGGCGASSLVLDGCLDTGGDVDHYEIVTPAGCDDPLQAIVRFPVAFAPLAVDLLDAAGAVVATGEVCDDLDEAGQTRVCLQVTAQPDTVYVLRIRIPDGAPDCNRGCAFNRFAISIL